MSRAMEQDIGLIGFGEAGSTFARAGSWGLRAAAFDILWADPTMAERIADTGIVPADSLAMLMQGAPTILSLVTADQALAVAQAAARHLPPGTLYCDGNSVAPQTKQAAARAVEAAGGHYVDVAIMAPVDPARLAVPLLLSGGRAAEAQARFGALGFGNSRIVGDAVGRASSIKMIRSVMVKGMEALTAECVIAARQADVLDEVLASLDASDKARTWRERADYNLDRMMVHGLRRAAEMEEVVRTLDGLCTGSVMTRGTVERQRAIGMLGLKPPPAGLAEKLATLAADMVEYQKAELP